MTATVVNTNADILTIAIFLILGRLEASFLYTRLTEKFRCSFLFSNMLRLFRIILFECLPATISINPPTNLLLILSRFVHNSKIFKDYYSIKTS